MLADTFADPQACGMFTGSSWPQPDGDEPGGLTAIGAVDGVPPPSPGRAAS